MHDDDEFDDAAARGVISDDERRAVLATCERLLPAIEARVAPFDGRGPARLDDAISLGLAPVTEVTLLS